MIHRPDDASFEVFTRPEKQPRSWQWLLNLILAITIGAAIAGIVTGLRGWSSRND